MGALTLTSLGMAKVSMGVVAVGLATSLSDPRVAELPSAARLGFAICAATLVFPICAEGLGKVLFQLLGSSLPFMKKGRITLHEGQKVVEGDIITQGKGYVREENTAYRNKTIDSKALEAGRYVLVANHGCPWVHRTLIARKLLNLEAAIPVASTATWGEPFFSRLLPAIATGGWR